jgi:hypothetical protein
MRSILFLSLISVLFIGCAYCPQCELTTSKGFDAKQPMKVLVMPVTANGNPFVQTHPNYSDALAKVFLKAGYTVVDRSVIAFKAKELGISIDDKIEDINMQQLAKSAGVDAVLLSSVAYHRVAAASGSQPATFNSETDTLGRVTISASGGSTYNRSEYYDVTSMSARLVDLGSMNTLLTAYSIPCGGKGVLTWITKMLDEKLNREE